MSPRPASLEQFTNAILCSPASAAPLVTSTGLLSWLLGLRWSVQLLKHLWQFFSALQWNVLTAFNRYAVISIYINTGSFHCHQPGAGLSRGTWMALVWKRSWGSCSKHISAYSYFSIPSLFVLLLTVFSFIWISKWDFILGNSSFIIEGCLSCAYALSCEVEPVGYLPKDWLVFREDLPI